MTARSDSDARIDRLARKLARDRGLTACWRLAPPLVPLIAIVVILLPLTPTYDLDVFLRAGHAVLHGQPFYPQVGSQTVYSGSSFVYPYFVVWPFVVLALLPSGVSTFAFFSVSAGAVLVACLVAADRDPWPAALVFASAFAITGLQLGAVSPLLFAGVVLLWRLRDRPVAFALLAGPVVASKLFLLPLLAWPLCARRWRAFAYAVSCTLALLALGFALGPLGPTAYAHVLLQLGSHEARSGFGLAGALMNIGASPALAQAMAIAIAATVLGAAYLHHRRRRDERVLFCSGIVAALLASPVVWSHYLVLLVAPLLVQRIPRRWLFVAALVTWAIAPPHGQHLDMDLVEGVASSGTWLLVLAVSLVVLVHSSRSARDRTAGA